MLLRDRLTFVGRAPKRASKLGAPPGGRPLTAVMHPPERAWVTVPRNRKVDRETQARVQVA